MAAKIVVQLTLQNGMNTEGTLYRIKKGWHVHFLLGSSLQGERVRFFTNHPESAEAHFTRSLYREVNIVNPTLETGVGSHWDTFDNHVALLTTHSGAFDFFFTTDGGDTVECSAGHGYFIVDPQFNANSAGEQAWEVDGLIVHTYLAKNLGKFVDWLPRLQTSYETGYNMVHFTPLQELGYSQSCYSLKDQLKVNSSFGLPDDGAWNEITKLVGRLESDWGMLSMTDLVYNHTASDSPWVEEHPEVGYNLLNSPHLRPAFLLDRVVWQLTLDAAEGKHNHEGLPNYIDNEGHLDAVKRILERQIGAYNLHELVSADVEKQVTAFGCYLNSDKCASDNIAESCEEVALIPNYERFGASVCLASAAHHFFHCHRDIGQACQSLRERLHQLNTAAYHDMCAHIAAAINNVLANARYRFLEPGGPKCRNITAKQPILWDYFKTPTDLKLADVEAFMTTPRAAQAMAYNGWVMADDPLRNFAESGSNVYLRRELIVWGDSVKLRYGDQPSDSPYLWSRMVEYTELTARLFHAVRLDNCHGTPLHVAQYMLDRARAVRNNLYIVAELFTGSEHVDNIFINKLGINSLIRESQSAWDSHEEGRLIYRYGGLPVGAFMQPGTRPLVPSVAHALFYDLTHDNPSPVDKRSAIDLLPSGALVQAACCATASTRGYDELVPHYIDVVSETRVYASWGAQVSQTTGIIAAKAAFNRLHRRLAHDHFTEVFVDQVDSDVVAVTRHCPHSHESVILIAHTAFSAPPTPYPPQHRPIRPIDLPGQVVKVEVFATMTAVPGVDPAFSQDSVWINGLPHLSCLVKEEVGTEELVASNVLRLRKIGEGSEAVELMNFPAGSVVALRVKLPDPAMKAIHEIRNCLTSQFSYRVRATSRGQLLLKGDLESLTDGSITPSGPTMREMAAQLSLTDLNMILFRCGPEENADFPGEGTYNIPGYKAFVYCGLQGVVSELSTIRSNNDLGHPVCDNLRQGDWLADYLSNRLIRCSGNLALLGQWMKEVAFSSLGKLPRYLVPSYFDAIITALYALFMDEVWHRLGDRVVLGSTLVRALSLGSVQFCGLGANSDLPQLAPGVLKKGDDTPSISAGFPHFAEGVFRNWGRDTFISLPGLLLLHGRFLEAKSVILGYGAVLRHGLIPNLLGCHKGAEARFNCRDAVWWWLASIQAYHRANPEDKLLEQPVRRIFPCDDSDGFKESSVKIMPLLDVIVEALQRHVDGIDYVERGAGGRLDEHMTEQGFHVTAGIDRKTGFPFGGNSWNCGTWMDKMGSSQEAGNRGRPATPRDGSAVELVGLCASTVSWLAQLHQDGQIAPEGVNTKTGVWTWSQWRDTIRGSFEHCFWIDSATCDPALVHNRGIYRDSVGSSQGFTDNQFRPNFLVALAIAPEFFTPERAWHALELVEEHLQGPLGLATLSPQDWAYRGYYDNGNCSNDSHVAKGFNYHQGPEWLWPVGYFFRAQLTYSRLLESSDGAKYAGLVQRTVSKMQKMLGRHLETILHSEWRSLPELTNKNGECCRDSCPAQAWSVACLNEAVHSLLSMIPLK